MSADDPSGSALSVEQALIKSRTDIARLEQLLNAAENSKAAIQENLTQSAALLAEMQSHHRESSAVATLSLAAKTKAAVDAALAKKQ